ncbi:anthranilate synthase component I family protein [Zeaxanthinibacter sp. PT1]|uniref:anthranilate synthase component I family protein n=1 Tax=Zeaxanthinibacter TaxID=561554 RepID=UPI0023493DCD|nr:anthranilate synthase component I family protein [Zeaxanthinibacter sp. PT1]MDC6351391.1 anthranilate synthase component I family protein [Zeaxanthinibacter sp. PT1]
MRIDRKFGIQDTGFSKSKLLAWSQQFEEVIWLDSNGHHDPYGQFDAVLAVGAHRKLVTGVTDAFDRLRSFRSETKDWIFGYLTYDLKNDLESLESSNADGLGFPDLYFFQPLKIIRLSENTATFSYLESVSAEIDGDFSSICDADTISPYRVSSGEGPKIKMRIFKETYFRRVQKMLDHIHRGDIYEANFCQEFYAERTSIDPLRVYSRLNELSMPPFASFIKISDRFLMCASPERFMRKIGQSLVSQPIKGTARRSTATREDQLLKLQLQHDEKERSENIMIVDLVRNDLSKHALKGSVEVPELCKVYSFKQVHQMISTVTAEVNPGADPVTLLRDAFPMGSMTGAPKVSAMKIIEELEATKRGLYSGSVGYFTPAGDFDFNVVIRSILYNSSRRFVSYSVGSAITAKATPAREYEECLLKARAMRQVLERESR